MSSLVDYLKRCDDAYYNTSNPIVSDATYDALVETLRKIDPTNEYLQKVGAKVRSNKVGRVIPMGTLSKYHKDEEVKEWLDSEKGIVLLSPKYDGFAVELYYQDGSLISASTRGDGNVGEDVLESILRIHNIPVKLERFPQREVIIRGEAIIPTKNHDKIKELGYSAMRNAVPGIVRACRKDALEYVDFVAYEFIDGMIERVSQREYWKDQFTIEDYRTFDYDQFDQMQKRREELRATEYLYELDGVVIKTNTIKEDDLLNPSHMIAWKYQSKLRETTLREIEFNVGATGAISVVGIFDPVEFQGASLSRASFGSLALYREMQPAVGDIIEVSRRGDIIPWIEGVTLGDPSKYQELTCCPCCGTPLIDDKCSNKECGDRIKLKLLQYIQGLKVKGLGQSLVKSLVDNDMIHSLVDIYTIDANEIMKIPRQGESVVAKWKDLQSKKLSPLEFLCAYPIENAGKSVWEKLLDKFSLSEIITLSVSELLDANVKGIGESKVLSLTTQLAENKDELERLITILDL